VLIDRARPEHIPRPPPSERPRGYGRDVLLDDLEGGNDLNPAESNAKMASGRPSPDMAPAHESIRLPPILGEDAGEFTPEPR
jgi:hypothetical protein